MTTEQEALREKVMREFTGHIASTCCHRTGGVNDDPKCECRVLADAAIAVVLKEASRVAGMLGGSVRQGNIDILYIPPTAKDAATAILSLIPQEEGK